MRKLVGLAALLLAAPAVGAAPAHAVECGYAGCSFNLQTGMGGASMNSNPGGQAQGRGTVIYASTTTVRIEVDRLADVCNSAGTGDGLGAYILVYARFTGGDEGYIQRIPAPWNDDDGCSNGSFGKGAKNYAITKTNAKFKSVRIRITECDVPSYDCYDSEWSTWKDNPLL